VCDTIDEHAWGWRRGWWPRKGTGGKRKKKRKRQRKRTREKGWGMERDQEKRRTEGGEGKREVGRKN